MTDVIVEVGPGTVRGPNDARPEWISAALECIDDDIALLGDRPVSVQTVWQEVIRAAAGDSLDTVILVCPTWWSSSRIDRVRAAARTAARTVVVLQRTPLLRDAASDRLATIVELAAEFVVVTRPGARVAVVPRRDDFGAYVEAVAAAVGASVVVLVDAPAGVDDAEPLGAAIADGMRAAGIAVRFTDDQSVLRAAAAVWAGQRDQPADDNGRPHMNRHRRGLAVVAGMLSAVALCGGFALRSDASESADDTPMALLVEGRVGVMVPATWSVQRIRSGPGSARVQIVSPSDTDVVLHVTQSTGMPHRSLAMAADSLRTALEEEPEGAFVDFNPSDHRAGKAAVTYREVRPEHHVGWTVLIDGTVRIAIGCQSPPGEDLLRDVCDQAIRSAHAVF